ncbi:lipoyl(octanoyl) transferase LipB [Desertifilum sp. FACHB-1129]|uniref:Octanoyltransferase n=1 Tax=Desertifilum tharense IPPAS B-1220 TaxID=1781255 RepID=A0A1E5QRI3_9CYAN|nr:MULTISPECIES: lipoyl(octanoyl) transferase LipB [Cyanophyceae]MCD8489939.1 lipoyl(octanoyl) transferase LipB [Desertifilum sp.]MDA0209474.1 lipoyl(octanoyl) transferase LipB [Cyanobacteria bacterium FC1]MDI9641801.1 lipoyl(octanoyl) transferase LipB [Geitlerinema splendidum]MBD2315216.1 lipoyl(octanoyl) transferase LipB [Desertifilum sp. FACHB-1129]MBD2324630.1 lipoyl(octanoyl) transferase LipB [Desertifilum sp. FACHB-866]
MISTDPLLNSPARPQRLCCLINQGIVPYLQAWEWQKQWVSERRDNPQLTDLLLLLEHPPVYTLGRGSTLDFLKFNPTSEPYEVHRIERGGEVTYHCPGQLVGYPILNLHYYQQDLHWYLRQLEETLIQALAAFNLKGDRIEGLTGVWVEGHKVAAIGIKVSRWITMHGFALNVSPDLKGFAKIVPCGIPDKPVGSLEQFIPGIKIDQVRLEIATAFATVFKVQLRELEQINMGASLLDIKLS